MQTWQKPLITSVGISPSSFPVPAGIGKRRGRNIVLLDAAPSLQVSVDWFNFLARAKAVALSSLHFLTPFTQLCRPDFVCYTKNSSERKGGIIVRVYWFIVWRKMFSDSRRLSNTRLRIWSSSPCTLPSVPLILFKVTSVHSEYSHIWILFSLSAHCPFPQSRFCIILLRSECLKCSNPSSTFRQPFLTHSRVMAPS